MAVCASGWSDDRDEPDSAPIDGIAANQRRDALRRISARLRRPEAQFSDFIIRSTGLSMRALGLTEYFDILAEAAFFAPCDLQASDATHQKFAIGIVEVIQNLRSLHDDYFALRLDLLAEIQRRSVSPDSLIDLVVRTEQEMWREPNCKPRRMSIWKMFFRLH